MFIDSHAHIYQGKFGDDLDEVIQKSQEKGVEKIFMPNVDSKSIDRMLDIEYRFSKICIPMMGLHPCSVKKQFEKELYIVEDWLSKRSFCAVGEIGLDYYWDTAFAKEQREALKVQIELAIKYKIPIVLHTRDSFDDTFSIMKEYVERGLKGVFHCFTGTVKQARKIEEIGFYYGLGGAVTFKNGGMEQVVPALNLDHILLETDAPYLTPVPYRGKRNDPSYIPLIAQKIADLKQIDIDTIGEKTSMNTLDIFGIN